MPVFAIKGEPILCVAESKKEKKEEKKKQKKKKKKTKKKKTQFGCFTSMWDLHHPLW